MNINRIPKNGAVNQTEMGEVVEDYMDLITAAKHRYTEASVEIANLEQLLKLALVNGDCAEFVTLDYIELKRQFL